MPAARTSFSELSVGQVAARCGLPVSTLHFYESRGLIDSTRTAGNQRRFSRGTLRRIAFIRAAQHVGIPLAEIRSALGQLPAGRTPTAGEWAALSRGWANRLDERIDQLTRLRDDLDRCIGCGCLSLGTCLLTNPYDVMSREGPGARRLLPGTPRPDSPAE